MRAVIRIDHAIDLITNSSSELFMIDATMGKEVIIEMINAAFASTSISVNEHSIEGRFFKEAIYEYEDQQRVESALSIFPDDAREEVKTKYFAKPKYWAITFDRDWICDEYGRDKLLSLGFELLDSDY